MSDRYFKNNFEDFSPNQLPIVNVTFVKSLIKKYVKSIIDNTDPRLYKLNSRSRADLYVGLAGISFMFLRMSQSQLRSEYPAINLAKTYIDEAEKALCMSGLRRFISLLSGNAGVHIVSAVVNQTMGLSPENDIKSLLKGFEMFEHPDYLDDGQDEMMVGRSGFLMAIQWLQQKLKAEIISSNEMSKLARIIIKSGRNYSRENHLAIPLMFQYHGREYLGAAHGISAILFSLLSTQLLDMDAKDLKATIDNILTLQDDDGNFPSKFNKSEANLVHWCHGGPGLIYLMAKAYKVYGEQKYLDSCIKCGELVWEKGLLKKGPSLCHGISSSGYVHLLLYRLTDDPKYLHRAMKFAEFLINEQFLSEAREPDRPFSLFEGISGTVVFLLDLLDPQNATFPFMNVF